MTHLYRTLFALVACLCLCACASYSEPGPAPKPGQTYPWPSDDYHFGSIADALQVMNQAQQKTSVVIIMSNVNEHEPSAVLQNVMKLREYRSSVPLYLVDAESLPDSESDRLKKLLVARKELPRPICLYMGSTKPLGIAVGVDPCLDAIMSLGNPVVTQVTPPKAAVSTAPKLAYTDNTGRKLYGWPTETESFSSYAVALNQIKTAKLALAVIIIRASQCAECMKMESDWRSNEHMSVAPLYAVNAISICRSEAEWLSRMIKVDPDRFPIPACFVVQNGVTVGATNGAKQCTDAILSLGKPAEAKPPAPKPATEKPRAEKPRKIEPIDPDAESIASAFLREHNRLRLPHCAKPLVWSETLEKSAQAWADHLAATEGCQMVHTSNPKYGENLATNQPIGFLTPVSAVGMWYDEVKLYDFENPGFSLATGHFTQVVWRVTQRIGCGMATCAAENRQIWVCQYDPPGNKQDRFDDNVKPAHSCS
jgi:uncharacterized protein YkwD